MSPSIFFTSERNETSGKIFAHQSGCVISDEPVLCCLSLST
jgi:hypothetical protein